MKIDKTSVITLIIIAIVIFGAAYYVWFSGVAKERKLETLPANNINKAVGSVNLTDLNDNPVTLADYKGSVVVANSWASWCPFCTEELKDFELLASEYKDKGVFILAINRAEPKAQIIAYLNTLPELSNLVTLQDKEDSYYKFIGGFSMPETIFYDTEGNVVFHKRGFMRLDEMQAHVKDSLKAGSE